MIVVYFPILAIIRLFWSTAPRTHRKEDLVEYKYNLENIVPCWRCSIELFRKILPRTLEGILHVWCHRKKIPPSRLQSPITQKFLKNRLSLSYLFYFFLISYMLSLLLVPTVLCVYHIETYIEHTMDKAFVLPMPTMRINFAPDYN